MTYEELIADFKKLEARFPKKPNEIITSENSAFGDYIANCKNVYYGFDAAECEDSFYIFDAYKQKSSIDCAYTAMSELVHENIDCVDNYNCTYMQDSGNCTNSAFLKNCSNCQDCFGCVYLSDKQYCFFNEQLTKEEYENRVAEYRGRPARDVLTEVAALAKKFPRYLTETNNEKSMVVGYAYDNKSVYYTFDAVLNEDSGYIYDSHRNKDCYDLTYSFDSQLCYEIVDSIFCNEVYHSKDIESSSNIYFSRFLRNCQECIGSMYLANQKFCILNKQYSEKEYRKHKQEILDSFAESRAAGASA